MAHIADKLRRKAVDCLANGITILHAREYFGATGAPNQTGSKREAGVALTRTGTGAYTLAFPACHYAHINIVPASGTIKDAQWQLDDDIDFSTGSAVVTHVVGGVATDPASGDEAFIRVECRVYATGDSLVTT